MGIFPTVSVRSTTPRLADALAHRGCVVTDAPESADVVIEVPSSIAPALSLDGHDPARDSDDAPEPREDLYARVDRSLLTPAEGLVVTGRHTGGSVALRFAPVDGDAL